MNRGSFLKGLITGAVSLTALSGISAEVINKDVNKLTDEQLNELYNAYVLDKEKRKKITDDNVERDRIATDEQNKIWESIVFINSAFYYKSKKVDKLFIKKHLKKLLVFQDWKTKWLEKYPGKYGLFNELDYVKNVDITISIIKAHLLLNQKNEAENLLTKFMNDRLAVCNFLDSYGLIYFGDMLYKAGYEKEALEYYSQSNKDNIKRWVQKLEDGTDNQNVRNEFLKRYYSKAYFGAIVYDNGLRKKKKFKTLPKWMLEV